MRDLILIGGGGHCRSCIDVIEQEGRFRIAAIIDQNLEKGTLVCGYPVTGTDTMLPELVRDYGCALVTVGQIKTHTIRKRLYETLLSLGAELATIVSPLAHVSRHALLGRGTIVMHQALVNAGADVGDNCIINTRALVEHDVRVGDHCHLATGCLVNGGARIEEGVFIGSGAVVRELVTITCGSVVGCGVTVRKNSGVASIW